MDWIKWDEKIRLTEVLIGAGELAVINDNKKNWIEHKGEKFYKRYEVVIEERRHGDIEVNNKYEAT